MDECSLLAYASKADYFLEKFILIRTQRPMFMRKQNL